MAKTPYDFSSNAVLDSLEPAITKSRQWKRLLSEPHDIESAKAQPGRPTKLDEKLQEKILNAITLGQSMERAALAAGIHRVTLWRWLEAGRAGREPYFSFFQEALSADARCERRMLHTIFIASQGGKVTVTEEDPETGIKTTREQTPVWTAAAWVLERKYGWLAPRAPPLAEEKPEGAGVPLEAIAAAAAAIKANTATEDEQRVAQMAATIAELRDKLRELEAAESQPG